MINQGTSLNKDLIVGGETVNEEKKNSKEIEGQVNSIKRI